jgi:3' terminal RNA ribose 2'-O-methyltransferase Hen1
MFLSITTTHSPATDLGFLLYKHPERIQTFSLSVGEAHVFYPEVSTERCTAVLALDVNPVGLVRPTGGRTFGLEHYVNDRPYVASSFLSVAIAQVYGSALAGRPPKDRAGLEDTPIPLEATVGVIYSAGGAALLERLFAPLGYTVHIESHPLDPAFPVWGQSHYYTLTLAGTTRLTDLLSHLYVLIPVLDNEKHYFVGQEEVEKLLRHGEGWLATHPEKELITTRYLKYRPELKNEALTQLAALVPVEIEAESEAQADAEEATVEAKISLHTQRLQAVLDMLKASGAQRVLDVGCGEGRLLQLLWKESQFRNIVGMDVSIRALEMAKVRLRYDRIPENQRERLKLIHGSLLYRDERLHGFEAAAVVEVIEHLDLPRLAAFERVLFEFAAPETVVITTPNAEYNVKWESLPAGQFRHRDHRFEWTRSQFETWAQTICERFGYTVEVAPIGEMDEVVGAPSQMGVFRKGRGMQDAASNNDDNIMV